MPKPGLSTSKANRKVGNHVTYVKPNGYTVNARVVGGSGNTLNLRLPHHAQASRELTNIARRTNLTGTNVWY